MPGGRHECHAGDRMAACICVRFAPNRRHGTATLEAPAARRGPTQPLNARKLPAKVAITLRLEADRMRQLQAIAAAENRSVTNEVKTALLRDLARHDEADRVITVYAAPGTTPRLQLEDVLRAEGESDAAYAERQTLLTELWSIPDSA